MIAERAGIDLRTFRYLYVLLSSHVHALPMSFYRMEGDGPGRGLPNPVEENYSALCMSLATSLLVRSRDEFCAMFIEHRQSPEPTAQVDETPKFPDLAIGEEKVVAVSDQLAFRWRQTADDQLETTYIDSMSGDAVLERVDHENGDVDLVWADPVYWTFIVNGGPATEASIEQALALPHAHRIDHVRRQILFKTAETYSSEATEDEPVSC